MARIVEHISCTFCGSEDNRAVYDDGHSFCYTPDCPKAYLKGDSMSGYEDLDAEFDEVKPSSLRSNDSNTGDNRAWLVEKVINEFKSEAMPSRKVSKATYDFYGVKVAYNSAGIVNEQYYPYHKTSVQTTEYEDQPQGFKIRVLPKDFKSKGSIGKCAGLFGMNKFGSGGKRLIITEGEEDCCALQEATFQHYKKYYPIVSLRSSSITEDLLEDRDKIRSYDEVILWMDNDEAGEKALQKAAKIIGYDKVKYISSSENDASDLWIKNKADVLKAVWNAKEYTPAGILTKEGLWAQLEAYNKIESVPYPPFMSGLNDKLKGMRFGEITLWTSGTGSGKSTLLREIVLWLLETTPDKVGIISLEESPAETARKMSGMSIYKNPAAEELTDEELKRGFDTVFGDDRVIVLDHHGSVADSRIVDHLEFMCLKGVKYLFLDHITLLVSEGADGLTGNEATDKVMNDLLRVVKKHDCWLGLISHLRKTPDSKGQSFEEGKLPSLDDIRGSGSIKQVSMDVIAFARDVSATDETVRNTIKTKVLKCRYTGLTGPTGNLSYDYETGRMTSAKGEFNDEIMEVKTKLINVKEEELDF